MVSEGILLAIVAAVCWGTSDFLAKIAVTREKNFIPAHIDALVSLIVVSIYVYLFPIKGYGLFDIVPQMALVSIFWQTGWWLFMLSLQEGKAGLQSAIGGSYSFIIVLLGPVLLMEAPTFIQLGGALLIGIGVITVLVTDFSAKKIKIDRNVLLAIFAAILWGFGFLVIGYFIKTIPPAKAYQSHIFFSTILGFLFVFAMRKKMLPDKLENLAPPAAQGVIEVAANLSYYTAASVFLTSLLAPVASIYPLFTIILAYIFLHERLKKFQFASIILILIGILLISI